MEQNEFNLQFYGNLSSIETKIYKKVEFLQYNLKILNDHEFLKKYYRN